MCGNNTKKLVGVAQLHDTHKALPSSGFQHNPTVAEPNTWEGSSKGSQLAKLLPFIEQTALYSSSIPFGGAVAPLLEPSRPAGASEFQAWVPSRATGSFMFGTQSVERTWQL